MSYPAKKIDPCAKCKTCGHSRWQHQDMSATVGAVKYTYKVEPAQCLKSDCTCKQFTPPAQGER